MSQYDSQLISVDGVLIHVLVSSTQNERWLILWTGICMPAEQFLPVLLRSSEQMVNVVIIDAPGHGLSGPWVGEFTEQSVELIWETVARHFGIKYAVIGGHSYGAL